MGGASSSNGSSCWESTRRRPCALAFCSPKIFEKAASLAAEPRLGKLGA